MIMYRRKQRSFYFLVLLTSSSIVLAEPPSKEWQTRARLAEKMDIGQPAPEWLINSEAYAGGVDPNDWDALAQSKVAFITHCPVNHELFVRCHALGIRCFPYVTFYQGFATVTQQGVNLKDHPEFIEVDEQGNRKRTGFWESEDAKNMYTTCPNTKEYQDAMVAWVRKIMEAGADGVFVDNLSSRAACFGPKFGKHKHIFDDQNHAFAMLLKRVREVVKQYQPDGAVLGNSADPLSLPKEFWKYLDSDMLESYICTWVSKDRWQDWNTHWNQAGRGLQPYAKAGKQVLALSYLGYTPYGVREDAFFCYASARLAGFVWNGGPLSNPETAVLYRLRLGKPLTDQQEENGVHYRVFERGLVAVNPGKEKAASITIAAPIPTKRFFDVFQRKPIDLTTSGKLEIPKYAGRVFLFASDTKDQLIVNGPTLTVVTAPPLGEVRFRVDGFDYWTYSGHWTTEYTLGPNFGKFSISFDKPGRHVVEVVDIVPADMKTPKGYGTGERLGPFMDPSNPTKPSAGKKFRFREWETFGKATKIEVPVSENRTLTSKFDVEESRK
jgi:hypothetical protein